MTILKHRLVDGVSTRLKRVVLMGSATLLMFGAANAMTHTDIYQGTNVVYAADKDKNDKTDSSSDSKTSSSSSSDDKASSSDTKTESDSGGSKGSASYYTVISEMVNAFNQIKSTQYLEGGDAKAPPADDVVDAAAWFSNSDQEASKSGNIGALVGFADSPSSIMKDALEVATFGVVKSNNSMSYSYKALANVGYPSKAAKGAGEWQTTDNFLGYAYYGRALSDLGFAKYHGGTTDSNIVTGITGMLSWVEMLLYYIAKIIPIMFQFTLWLLDVFNPFKWIGYLASKSNSLIGDFMGSDAIPKQLEIIAQPLVNIYDGIVAIGWAVVLPMVLALGMGFFFLGNSKIGKSMLKNFWVMLLIMGFAVPVVGATYTGILDYLRNEIKGQGSMSAYNDYLMASSYLTFEDWAYYTRLAPADENGNVATSSGSAVIGYDSKANKAVVNTTSLRKAVLATNLLAARAKNDSEAESVLVTALDTAGTEQGLSSNAELDQSQPTVNKSNDTFSFKINEMFDTKSFKYINSLMTSAHSTNSRIINGADYESFASAAVSNDVKAQEAYNSLLTLNIKDLEQTTALLSTLGASYGKGKDAKADTPFAAAIQSGYKYNLYNNGRLSDGDAKEGSVFEYYVSGSIPNNNNNEASKSGGHISGGSTAGYGLSDLSMYNFLFSEFGSTSLTVLSSKKSASLASTAGYQSIALAGDSMTGLLTVLENIVVMIASISIGFVIISSLLSRIFGLSASVFGASFKTAFGSWKGFGELLVFAGSLTLHVIASVMAFTILNEFLIVILNLTSSFGSGSISFGAIGVPVAIQLGVVSDFINIGVRILGILLILVFIRMFTSNYVKKVVNGIDQASNSIIQRFFGKLMGAAGLDANRQNAINQHLANKTEGAPGEKGQDIFDKTKQKAKDLGNRAKDKKENFGQTGAGRVYGAAKKGKAFDGNVGAFQSAGNEVFGSAKDTVADALHLNGDTERMNRRRAGEARLGDEANIINNLQSNSKKLAALDAEELAFRKKAGLKGKAAQLGVSKEDLESDLDSANSELTSIEGEAASLRGKLQATKDPAKKASIEKQLAVLGGKHKRASKHKLEATEALASMTDFEKTATINQMGALNEMDHKRGSLNSDMESDMEDMESINQLRSEAGLGSAFNGDTAAFKRSKNKGSRSSVFVGDVNKTSGALSSLQANHSQIQEIDKALAKPGISVAEENGMRRMQHSLQQENSVMMADLQESGFTSSELKASNIKDTVSSFTEASNAYMGITPQQPGLVVQPQGSAPGGSRVFNSGGSSRGMRDATVITPDATMSIPIGTTDYVGGAQGPNINRQVIETGSAGTVNVIDQFNTRGQDRTVYNQHDQTIDYDTSGLGSRTNSNIKVGLNGSTQSTPIGTGLAGAQPRLNRQSYVNQGDMGEVNVVDTTNVSGRNARVDNTHNQEVEYDTFGKNTVDRTRSPFGQGSKHKSLL